MPLQMLAEVFGYNVNDETEEATRCRKLRLCPFFNRIPNCNNEKAKNPLGTCSIFEDGKPIIVCPVRLRQNWKIITDIIDEFFPSGIAWTTVADVKLYDKFNKLIDTVDFVIVAYDRFGTIIDFISLDTLGISLLGSLRQQFNQYIKSPKNYFSQTKVKDISPDYPTSLNKRLTPQVIFKASVFQNWGKKTIYALDINLFNSLPEFIEVEKNQAEISWFSYELVLNKNTNNYGLKLVKISHTLFQPTLFEMTKIEPGPIEGFILQLQQKLEEKIDPTSNETSKNFID